MRLLRSVWFIRTVEVFSAFSLIAAGFAWGRGETVRGVLQVLFAAVLWWVAVILWRARPRND